MFNLQGGELIIIALLALVVLGPEKLPEAMRHVGRLYRQLRSVRDTFQREFKQALDEPMRDLRKATSGSANTLREAARSMVDAPDDKAESGNTTPSPAPSEQTEDLEGESETPSDDAERP